MLFAVLAGGCASSSTDLLQSALGSREPPAQTGSGETRTVRIDDERASLIATSAATSLVSSATPGATTYKIGPQDVLEISVFKVTELSKSVQVADSGTINLPLLGDVTAAGRTAQDIERDMVRRLGEKYLRNPQVTVFVKEYNSQRITVEGAVKKPGVFPYRGRATLLQAIAMAEGLDAVSDTNVVVIRQVDGRRAAAKFDIAEIRAGKTHDPQIESGDVVIVAASAMKETFGTMLKLIPLAGVFALL